MNTRFSYNANTDTPGNESSPGVSAPKAPNPNQFMTYAELMEKASQSVIEPSKQELDGYTANEVETPINNNPLETVNAEGYTRIEVLSGGIFYNHAPIAVRAMRGAQVRKISKSAQEKSLTLLIDAIGETLHNFDVRNLTHGDFKFLMYYHRLVSFVKVPWTFRWTSVYGNENEITMTGMGDIHFKPPSMTAQDYQTYLDAGLCVPTMRDIEYMENQTKSGKRILDDETYFAYERAAYFKGKTFKEKLKALDDAMPEQLVMVGELMKRSHHDVKEVATVRDEHFDPEIWVKELNIRIENCEPLTSDFVKSGMVDEASRLRENIDIMKKEVARIEDLLANGKEVQPEEEEVAISMTGASFLSGL